MIDARDRRRDCSVTGQWIRYVDVSGRLLDRNLVFDDPRFDPLELKLGLSTGDGDKPTPISVY